MVPLTLPPLRNRTEDVELLLEHFLAESSQRFGLVPPRFSMAALKILRNYSWPGNVRELRNLTERLVVLCNGRTLDSGNLPSEIISETVPDRGTGDGFRLPDQGIVLDELEADIIRQALDLANGNRSRAYQNLLWMIGGFDMLFV